MTIIVDGYSITVSLDSEAQMIALINWLRARRQLGQC
jgi:hypothetical protein